MKNIRLSVVILSLTLLGTQLTAGGAPSANEGKALVDKNGCTHCHIIEGDGGTVAPPLDGINQHRDRKYIISRIANKSIQAHVTAPYPLPDNLMQHVHVNPAEAKSIADYLLSLPDREAKMKAHGEAIGDTTPAGSHFVPLKPDDSTHRGATLYKDHGCMACHSIGSVGGHIGPNLAGVGVKRSRAFIENRIANGAILIPKPGDTKSEFAMPPSDLSKQQVDDLTNFLLTLPAAKK